MELGIHQNSMWLALTFKHLSHHGTKAFIPTVKKSMPNVCSQEVTACFASLSVTNFFPAKCFVRSPERSILVGPTLPTRLMNW
jgi:hypothetical protein